MKPSRNWLSRCAHFIEPRLTFRFTTSELSRYPYNPHLTFASYPSMMPLIVGGVNLLIEPFDPSPHLLRRVQHTTEQLSRAQC